MPGYFSPYKIFNADAELYNIIIQGTLKALIMRDYDTTISPLSDSQENSWFGLSFGL